MNKLMEFNQKGIVSSPCVVGPSVKPNFRRRRSEPKDFGQIVTLCVFQCVFEHFHLLHQRQMIVVGRHLNDIPFSRDATVQRVNGK